VVALALVMALVIAAMRETEVAGQIAAEVRLEIVLPVAAEIARAIDPVAQEIVAQQQAEIALGVVTFEAVLKTGVASETVLDTAAEAPAQTAAGVPPAWVVREGTLAEAVAGAEAVVAAVGEAVVAAEVVAVVAGAVGDGEDKPSGQSDSQCFASSSLAIASRWTSSGPSARRRVRTWAQAPARKVSCETPAPPCA
jgi:hypothetical protein